MKDGFLAAVNFSLLNSDHTGLLVSIFFLRLLDSHLGEKNKHATTLHGLLILIRIFNLVLVLVVY